MLVCPLLLHGIVLPGQRMLLMLNMIMHVTQNTEIDSMYVPV